MLRKDRRQSGDTIVEVLLSVTILSTILVITYSLVTRAFRSLQIARDQMQATLIAQEQLEAVVAVHRASGTLSEFQSNIGTSCAGSPIVPDAGFLMAETGGVWCTDSHGAHPDPGLGSLYAVQNTLNYSRIPSGAGTPNAVTVTSTVRWVELGSGINREQDITTRLRFLP